MDFIAVHVDLCLIICKCVHILSFPAEPHKLKETSPDAENIWKNPSGLSTDHSSDLEWEPDFVSAE